jgi:hypothetical protein
MASDYSSSNPAGIIQEATDALQAKEAAGVALDHARQSSQAAQEAYDKACNRLEAIREQVFVLLGGSPKSNVTMSR